MLKRFDDEFIMGDDKYGFPVQKRVHSLNSLLKDKTYNSKESSTLKRIAKMGSRIFNSWNNSPPTDWDDHNDSYPFTKPELSFAFDPDVSQSSPDQQVFLKPKKLRHVTLSKSNQNIGSLDVKPKSELDLTQRRIIVIKSLPKNSSISGVLNRVCGGPLERVVYRDNRLLPSVELYFILPKDAQRFFKYGSTGLLTYNGVHLDLEWANETNTENTTLQHPKISKSLVHSVLKGATRCLLFVKEIPKSVPSTDGIYYPDPTANYSKDFHIKTILMDFAPLGNIIDFSPVISKKLSFCLYFDDIRSAIIIKKQCETFGTKLHDKYNGWAICFGKDITDKPCLVS